jgi:hypothetical protein
MPSAIDKLRNKLRERLNWDTFIKEIGQGMETLPNSLMVMNPKNAGIIYKNLKQLKALGASQTDLGLAYFNLKHPKLSSIAPIRKEFELMNQGSFDPIENAIRINPDSTNLRHTVEALGHETTHAWQNLKPNRIKSDPQLFEKVMINPESRVALGTKGGEDLIEALGGLDKVKEAVDYQKIFPFKDETIPYYRSGFFRAPKEILSKLTAGNRMDQDNTKILRRVIQAMYENQPYEALAMKRGNTALNSFRKFKNIVEEASDWLK